ncbi:hypothetical protein Droror1_Dr00027735, partial [Drosera rotundifolia]
LVMLIGFKQLGQSGQFGPASLAPYWANTGGTKGDERKVSWSPLVLVWLAL